MHKSINSMTNYRIKVAANKKNVYLHLGIETLLLFIIVHSTSIHCKILFICLENIR